jgi:hypothetical protein
MAHDLADDLAVIARIRQHLPCLEAAAGDESAPAEVRAAVAAMAQLARSAAEVTGQHRTIPNDLEPTRTETNQ